MAKALDVHAMNGLPVPTEPGGDMPPTKSSEARVMAGILGAIERDGSTSQRSLARELGVAVGLVNAYVKRCSKKGLIKIRQVPASRYAYYLTPKGLAEKSRLTAEYFTTSLSFFRDARKSCGETMDVAVSGRSWKRVALLGSGDLAEIAILCAFERGLEVAAVIDEESKQRTFVGVPVLASTDEIADAVDGFILTAMHEASEILDAAAASHGDDRVLVPGLLGLMRPRPAASAARPGRRENGEPR